MSALSDTPWTTAITNVQKEKIEIRGYDLVDLIGNVSFADQIFLVITGELPRPEVSRVFEAVLCAAIDHGPGTPSALAARTAISGGAAINGAAATGLLTLGDHHGAAVEACMRLLASFMDPARDSQGLTEKIEACLTELKEKGKHFPGVGHRLHAVDPRVARMWELAEANGLKGRYVACINEVSRVLSEQKGKPVPVNVDGAIAALLCEIGFPVAFGNVAFMISRIVGIFTQAMEEKLTQKPMRHIDPVNFTYIGPASRSLKE